MARQPDRLCAGGCGELLWRGTGSTDNPTCRNCRREQARKSCEQCGGEFSLSRRGRHRTRAKFCSKACQRLAQIKYADPRAASKANSRARRAVVQATWDGVTDEQILERDAWVCQIPDCLKPIAPELPWPHPGSAVVDHVLPLSRGGRDDSGNKRAAHSICNGRKSDRLDSEMGWTDAVPVEALPSRRREPKAPKTLVEPRVCALDDCASPFYVRQRSQRKFCSTECAEEQNRRRSRNRYVKAGGR